MMITIIASGQAQNPLPSALPRVSTVEHFPAVPAPFGSKPPIRNNSRRLYSGLFLNSGTPAVLELD
jgi:hypothetical protein